MKTHEKLLSFTHNIALPYILELPLLQEYLNEIDILLVGSAATGLCTEKSDVDICILCSGTIYSKISKDTNWSQGRPSKIVINEIQLHYYAINVEVIKKSICQHNDLSYYIYSTAKILYKKGNHFDELRTCMDSYLSSKKRITLTYNKLTSRRRALDSIFADSDDPVLRISIVLEILELVLYNIANMDRIAYNRRKRLYKTSLRGKLGQLLKPKIDSLVKLVSLVSDSNQSDFVSTFLSILDNTIEAISQQYLVKVKNP